MQRVGELRWLLRRFGSAIGEPKALGRWLSYRTRGPRQQAVAYLGGSMSLGVRKAFEERA